MDGNRKPSTEHHNHGEAGQGRFEAQDDGVANRAFVKLSHNLARCRAKEEGRDGKNDKQEKRRAQDERAAGCRPILY